MRILYIDVDSLRPDHLGCYGYLRNTSPNIDSLAAESVRFTNVYATDTPCLPSRTAFWSGRFGYQTGVVGHGGTAAQPFIEGAERHFSGAFAKTSWMACLRALGYKTATISSFGERHAAWHWYAGFNEIYNVGRRGNEDAHEVNEIALDWLNRHAQDDEWFLHINYWDPHTAYTVPESYGNPFENDPIEAWYTQEMLDRCLASYGPHSALEPHHEGIDLSKTHPRMPERIDSLAAVKHWIDGYDVGVRYMDDHLGLVFQALKDAGVYDDTIIIISADHGENLGELNVWGDHQTADAITNRVPLIVRYPNITQERVDTGLHYQFDWAATLIELLGGTMPDNWNAESFKSAFEQGDQSSRPYVILSQNAWSCQRSVRFDQYVCIRTYHDGLKEFEPIMLFDLDTDPHEQNNLAAAHPEIVNQAMAYLADWEQEMRLQSPSGVDPMMTVLKEGGPFHTRGQVSGYIERLEQMGAHEQAERLRQKHS